MCRGERWTDAGEITNLLQKTTDLCCGAGPILFRANGINYTDDSEAHIAVIGRTGKGKSQCCSLPFIREILNRKESAVILDPKKECFIRTSGYIPDEYQKFCIDFRDSATSPTSWNPLSLIYQMHNSEQTCEQELSNTLVYNLVEALYFNTVKHDRYWDDAAKNLIRGLIYMLIDRGNINDVNFEAISKILEAEAETNDGCGSISSIYLRLVDGSLAKRNLSTYVGAPPDKTRPSILSTVTSRFEVFSRSQGLIRLLKNDTLRISEIDLTKPFIIYVVLPDETDTFDFMGGILISQISLYLFMKSQEFGGKLPIRVNMVLEELGSTGRGIPTLANLLVAGRSRNVRLMLILQAMSQLADLYGKSKSETINASVGITIGFSTNSLGTLNEWSERCGYKNTNGVKAPLISGTEIAAMHTGTALIMIDGRYKYVARLPMYHELYENTDTETKSHLQFSATNVAAKQDDNDYLSNYATIRSSLSKDLRKKLKGLANEKDTI